MHIDIHKGIKVCTLTGVSEYCEGYPVELWLNRDGKTTIVAESEGGNNLTQIDMLGLIDWLRLGPVDGRIEGGFVMEENTNHGSCYSGDRTGP